MEQVATALDAWAVLALLRDEDAADRVESAIEEGSVCSWINLGEALYIETRRVGRQAAMAAVEALADNVLDEVPDRSLVGAAAEIKAGGGLSYSDCFAVATAERHRVPLLTGDAEILSMNRDDLRVIDPR